MMRSAQLASFNCNADDDTSWRTRLPIVVSKIISGVTSGDDETTRSSVETSLEYLRYNITHKPFMFVAAPTFEPPEQFEQDHSRAVPCELTVQEQEAHALSSWLIERLLYVLSELPEGQPLWRVTVDLIPFLLQTIRSKDTHAYQRVASLLILTLADFTQISDRLYEGVEDDLSKSNEKLQLSRFRVFSQGGSDATSDVTLAMTSPEVCEKMQCAVSEMLLGLTGDLCLFAGSGINSNHGQTDVLWATLATQLEFGEIALKTVSVRLGTALLEQGGLCRGPALHYYLDCVRALLDLLCSGFDEVPGDYIGLEEATADHLERLLTAASAPSVPPSDSCQAHRLLVTDLAHVLATHGTRGLRSARLPGCLLGVLTRAAALPPSSAQKQSSVATASTTHTAAKTGTGRGPDPPSSGSWSGLLTCEQRKQLNRRLVAEIGLAHDSLYAVGWLRSSILLDMAANSRVVLVDLSASVVTLGGDSQTTNGGTTTATDTEPHSSGEEEGRRGGGTRQAPSLPTLPDIAESVTSCGENVVERSHTVVCVRDRLMQLCGWLSDQQQGIDPVCVLAGIHACLEVLTWILVKADTKTVVDCDVLGPTTLSTLTKMWHSYLVGCLQGDPQRKRSLSRGLAHVVKAIACLVFAQDVIKVTEHLTTFTWMLSINWLPNEMSWNDLRPAQHKEIVRCCANIDDQTVPAEVLEECVHVLSLMPKAVAIKWRTHVVLQALSDTRESVKAAALSSFPLFLLYAGPSANHIVHSALHALVADPSVEVQRRLAELCGPLACVVSRKATINRSLASGDPVLTSRSLSVRCVSCQHTSKDSEDTRERPRTVDPTMFLPFLALVHSPDLTVRINLVHSIPRLFGHLRVRTSGSSAASVLSACLNFMHDEHYAVRSAFSSVCMHVLPERPDGEAARVVYELLTAKLKQCRRVARQNDHSALMETLNLTAGSLSRHTEHEELVSVLLLMLLESLCCPLSPLAASTAHAQLQAIGAAKRLSMRHLYLRHGNRFSKTLVSLLHQQPDSNPLSMVGEVVNAFQFESPQAFFKRTEQFLFPHLVMKATPTAAQLTRVIAQQLGDPNHKGPLTRNIRYIFSHLVCATRTDEELTQKFKFLEEESGLGVEALVRCEGWPLMTGQLMFHLAAHKEKVMKGFLLLCRIIEGGSEPGGESAEAVAGLLQDKILGILVQFDNRLNNGTISLPEKMETYESVVSLMELMGSQHVTSVRHRLMTTLRIGLRYQAPGFPELCCRAWNVYVRSIEVGALGPMLAQIAVSLLPLLSRLPQQVADIFSYLIVHHRANLKEHLGELYFIPDIPELKSVNDVLRQYTTIKHSTQSVKDQVSQLVKGISHESQDVRQHALTKLRTLLQQNQQVLHQLISASETVDPVVSQLITALLDGCRDSAPELRPLYGECLGELGAVDPGRLDSLDRQRAASDLRNFQPGVLEHSFAFDFLTLLAQAYLRAEDRTKQDCVAYAIQELVQVYEIVNDPASTSPGARLWRRFSDEIQEIIQPLMKSQYILRSQYDWSQYPKPLYRSKKGSSFPQWVSALTGYLGSRIDENEQVARVFNAAKGVIKNDHQMALYLLPHAVVHVLLEAAPDVHIELEAEILAVLNHVKEPSGARSSSCSDLGNMAAQTVFSVMDHLHRWTLHRLSTLSTRALREAATRGRGASSATAGYRNDPCYARISDFLERIPQETLALASNNCGAYTRALMHHEQYLRAQQKQGEEGEPAAPAQHHLDFMQKLYVSLDEPDGVAGITTIKHAQPTLGEQILAYESTGHLADAAVCYDSAIRRQPTDLTLRHGLLRCRLALGELHSVLEQTDGIIADTPEWRDSLNAYRTEAAWKLGQWQKLDSCLRCESVTSSNWNVALGRILLAARRNDASEYSRQVALARAELMSPLSAASMEIGSYQRGYEYIVRLHMLTELQQGMRTLFELNSEAQRGDSEEVVALPLAKLLDQWGKRLEYTQYSFRTQEPILTLRRAVLSLAREEKGVELDSELGHCWLRTANIARQCGLVQTAHSSLLSASAYKLPEFCIEKAKWLWERGDVDSAQNCLEKALEEHYPDRAKFVQNSGESPASLTPERVACAKVLLLLVTYNDETSKLESTAIVRQYKEVTKMHGQWEDAYFQTGKYYDKIMNTLITVDRPEKIGEFVQYVVQNFGQSLWYGSAHIYQSLPRMLSLWLDYGVEVATAAATHARSELSITAMRNVLTLISKRMAEQVTRIATYQFLTAFPQLISRICHTHPEVFQQLRDIIARVLCDYPQQAMWLMMAVSKSSYNIRSRRCLDIFNHARSVKPELAKLLQDATKLTDKLLDLCNKPCAKGVQQLSIATDFKPLQRLLDDRQFSAVLLPLQSLMTVTLPASGTPADHQPFPGDQVYIRGLEDTVELLPSLQRPKKVTMQGSDGKLYIMLCKPKDDLRKDARLMEFNGIVNKFFRKDPEARRRNLLIRTFTVTPLNEECGMLEWVHCTSGLRNILMKLYKERGLYTSGTELQAMQLPPNAPLQKKLDMFRNRLLPKHPAIFSEWFLRTFPDPTAWYNARLAYCRTLAVMSMTGYILGLGDRHGENILMDSTNGCCVHVDFNCLFNRGETFEYPEIVPFRLTHNLVEAMGPMGYEGVFRRACEVSLRVMRDQTDPLMSVIKSFIYDPLVEWSKPARGRANQSDNSGEIKNEMAQTHVNNIEARLKGILKGKQKPRGLALSVEGHVNHLIREATDENKLCQMYLGWAPYL